MVGNQPQVNPTIRGNQLTCSRLRTHVIERQGKRIVLSELLRGHIWRVRVRIRTRVIACTCARVTIRTCTRVAICARGATRIRTCMYIRYVYVLVPHLVNRALRRIRRRAGSAARAHLSISYDIPFAHNRAHSSPNASTIISMRMSRSEQCSHIMHGME